MTVLVVAAKVLGTETDNHHRLGLLGLLLPAWDAGNGRLPHESHHGWRFVDGIVLAYAVRPLMQRARAGVASHLRLFAGATD